MLELVVRRARGPSGLAEPRVMRWVNMRHCAARGGNRAQDVNNKCAAAYCIADVGQCGGGTWRPAQSQLRASCLHLCPKRQRNWIMPGFHAPLRTSQTD
jgi:hypothetical protein